MGKDISESLCLHREYNGNYALKAQERRLSFGKLEWRGQGK